MSLKTLTSRQKEVMNFIAGFFRGHLYMPSFREIGAAIGVSSTNAVNDHLEALKRKGWLDSTGGRVRGIVLSEYAKQRFDLVFVGGESIHSRILDRVLELVDKGSDALDLSTSVGSVQGADTAFRAIRMIVNSALEEED